MSIIFALLVIFPGFNVRIASSPGSIISSVSDDNLSRLLHPQTVLFGVLVTSVVSLFEGIIFCFDETQ